MGPVDVAEGYYLGHIVYQLHRSGLLERLGDAQTPAELAADQGFDAELFRTLLEYVRQRTDIVLRDGPDRYRLNPEYATYHQFGFHLDKLIGAYGEPVRRLEDSLRSASLGRRLVDGRMLAEAFYRVGAAGVAAEARVVREWRIGHLLDLGCGPGALLLELAADDPVFRGVGIDGNPAMCEAATASIVRAGLAKVLRIIHGDARDVADLLAADERDRIDGLHCRSLVNELFRFGPAEAAEFVAQLARHFRGRLLLVGDYYGKLGSEERVPDRFAHTLLQDLAQAVSSQGIPPPDLAGWADVYEQGGAELLHAYEGEHAGIAWFVHVVRL
jgi:SAM-dependent methyltransferase